MNKTKQNNTTQRESYPLGFTVDLTTKKLPLLNSAAPFHSGERGEKKKRKKYGLKYAVNIMHTKYV